MLREGLWRSAVVHLMKCYGGHKARCSLDHKDVLKGGPQGKEVFKFFEALRNKHFVHDENTYSPCLPGAILNKEAMGYKIAKITCMAFHGQTLDQRAFGNLHLLITRSMEWVTRQFGVICEALTTELEALPYADLLKRDAVAYSPPKVTKIDTPRKSF